MRRDLSHRGEYSQDLSRGENEKQEGVRSQVSGEKGGGGARFSRRVNINDRRLIHKSQRGPPAATQVGARGFSRSVTLIVPRGLGTLTVRCRDTRAPEVA